MELKEAIETLKKAVKYPGTIDQKHIDLSVIPVEQLPKFEKALVVAMTAIKEGTITRDEFNRRVHLDT